MASSPLLVPLVTAMAITFFYLYISNVAPTSWTHLRHPIKEADSVDYTLDSEDVKVPVVLGVMSRCPDALLCEAVFDQVLEQVGDKVNISLSFIAKENPSDHIFGVTCMHGTLECAGNVQELCAAKYLPQPEWWSFVQCENSYGRAEVGTPKTAKRCAASVGFDWDGSEVGACADVLTGRSSGHSRDFMMKMSVLKEIEGVTLLKESVRRSQELGISKSCTIMINGKQVCVHDGTWKDCENGHEVEDFVRQINNAYDELSS